MVTRGLLYMIVISVTSAQTNDWNSISPGYRVPSHGSQIQSLQLRTEGQGHFDLHFGSEVAFECDLYDWTTSYKFDLHYLCEDYYGSCCSMYGVPISWVRIWTLTLTPTTLHIYCRRDGEGEEANVEVMAVSYSTLDHCLYESEWPSLLSNVQVYSDDIVTRAYRIISDTCTGLDESWLNVRTTSTFPVNYYSKITLECETGYVLSGDKTVTCLRQTSFLYTNTPVCTPLLISDTVLEVTNARKKMENLMD